MSSLVKLSSRLPGDPEINGLDSLADKLLDLDAEPTVALVWLSTAKVTTDRSHEQVPTVEVVRIEPLGPLSEVPASIIELAATLYEGRTGRTALPFDAVLDDYHGEVEVGPHDDGEGPSRGDVAEVFVFEGRDK